MANFTLWPFGRTTVKSANAVAPMVNVFDDAPLPVLVASSPTTSYRVVKTILGPLLDINPDERDMLLDTLAAFFAFRGSAIEVLRRMGVYTEVQREHVWTESLHFIGGSVRPTLSRKSMTPSARPVKPMPVSARKERRVTPGQRCWFDDIVSPLLFGVAQPL